MSKIKPKCWDKVRGRGTKGVQWSDEINFHNVHTICPIFQAYYLNWPNIIMFFIAALAFHIYYLNKTEVSKLHILHIFICIFIRHSSLSFMIWIQVWYSACDIQLALQLPILVLTAASHSAIFLLMNTTIWRWESHWDI